MTDHSVVKVRKIIYNDKGFQYGVLMPEYSGTIDDAFNAYSKVWMSEYTDKTGNIVESISEKDVNMMEEFTVKDSDYFYIGLPNTYAYEGISEDYEGYGCELDRYGFERMLDTFGKPIPYFDAYTK